MHIYCVSQENGLTFSDRASEQQLLNPGEQSYVDHFWVSCAVYIARSITPLGH